MRSFSDSQSSLIVLSGEGRCHEDFQYLVSVSTRLGNLRNASIRYRLLQFKYVRPLIGMHVLAAGNGAVISEERHEHSPINSLAHQKS